MIIYTHYVLYIRVLYYNSEQGNQITNWVIPNNLLTKIILIVSLKERPDSNTIQLWSNRRLEISWKRYYFVPLLFRTKAARTIEQSHETQLVGLMRTERGRIRLKLGPVRARVSRSDVEGLALIEIPCSFAIPVADKYFDGSRCPIASGQLLMKHGRTSSNCWPLTFRTEQ